MRKSIQMKRSKMFCSNRRSSSSDDLTMLNGLGPCGHVPLDKNILRRTRAFLPPGLVPSPVTRPCSDLTRENCTRIMTELGEKQLERSHLQNIQTLLDRCTKGDNVLDIVDERDMNILQKAVVNNQVQIVSILIKKGIDVNGGFCTYPLHLACKLGFASIVRVLLDGGARADLSSRICYPLFHTPKPQGTLRNKAACHPNTPLYTPLFLVLANDRDEVLEVLLDHPSSREFIKREGLVHDSCFNRAKRCLKLLALKMPEYVTTPNRKGATPLTFALNTLKSRESAVILLESPAQFGSEMLATDDGTLLHQLYVDKDYSQLQSLTQLMLENGGPSLVHCTSKDGDTLLIKLLKFYGSNAVNDPVAYSSEVRGCIELLLFHGCNPNQPNKKGETALHALFCDHDSRPLLHHHDRTLSAPYITRLLTVMKPFAEILIASGANTHLRYPPYGVPPLYYLMKIVVAMSPGLLLTLHAAEQVIQVIELLCSSGADPNDIGAADENILSMLLGALSRWLYHAQSNWIQVIKLVNFTTDLFNIFLKYGLRPCTALARNLKQFAILFNTTIPNPSFIPLINRLMCRLICAGGDPNTLNKLEFQQASSTSRFTVCYYLARALYIQWRDLCPDTAFLTTEVFCNTLIQPLLTQYADGIYRNLQLEFEKGQLNYQIQERVRGLVDNVRPLKKLVRIAIYTAVQWKIPNCTRLPLPNSVITYLLEPEHIRLDTLLEDAMKALMESSVMEKDERDKGVIYV